MNDPPVAIFGNVARGENADTAARAVQYETNGLDDAARQRISERLGELVRDIIETTQAPITAVILEIVRSVSQQGLVAARALGRHEGLKAPRPTIGRDYVTISVAPKPDAE